MPFSRQFLNEMVKNVAREVVELQEAAKIKLPDFAIADIERGAQTVAKLVQAGVLNPPIEQYDLAPFSTEQLGGLRGSDGHGLNASAADRAKTPLPDYAHNDVISGNITVSLIFSSKSLPGEPSDYDLSPYTLAQLG